MPQARRNPPFRAEHIGSLLRPPELLSAIDDFDAGRLSAEALAAAEERAIRSTVKLQEEIGFGVVTDGEYRRRSYSDSFLKTGLSGVRSSDVSDKSTDFVDEKGNALPALVNVIDERIRWQETGNARDFAFLKSLTKVTPKMTLPGPCYLHFGSGRKNISREVYPNMADFWSDLAAAYHTEFARLAEVGCQYIQIDETSLAKLSDTRMREALAARGDHWENLLHEYINAINAVVAGAPKGMRIGIHLCRGNYRGLWQAEGGYEVVADKLFREARLGFYFLEYDTARAGGFEPLRMVPDDKVIILGLISTKTGKLEPEEALIGRIYEAARYVSLDRLCISPQCGFASDFRGNPLNLEEQTTKLRTVVSISQKVWPNS